MRIGPFLQGWPFSMGAVGFARGRECPAEEAVGRSDARQRRSERPRLKKTVTPDAKRDAVAHARAHHGLSAHRACSLIGINRRVARYRPSPADDTALRQRLRELAGERRRFSCRRLGDATINDLDAVSLPDNQTKTQAWSATSRPNNVIAVSVILSCSDRRILSPGLSRHRIHSGEHVTSRGWCGGTSFYNEGAVLKPKLAFPAE